MHPATWASVLSTTELFEMSAMIRELGVLQGLEADDEAICGGVKLYRRHVASGPSASANDAVRFIGPNGVAVPM